MTSEDQPPEFGDYLIAVSIRGKDTDSLNLTACGHKKIYGDEEPVMSDKEGWFARNNFKSISFKITQALDVFSHEVQQRDLTYFTGVHETNQIISLFG